MSDEVKNAIEKMMEVKEILEKFSTREEAVEYLMKETKLSREECSNAYDFYMKIDLSKEIDL